MQMFRIINAVQSFWQLSLPEIVASIERPLKRAQLGLFIGRSWPILLKNKALMGAGMMPTMIYRWATGVAVVICEVLAQIRQV
jgi:hypothetical protein